MTRAPLTFALLFGVEVLWAGSASVTELCTAAGLAIALTGWTVLLRGVSHRRFHLTSAAWRPTLRAGIDLPGATLRTVIALCRASIPARADELGFRHGREDDPRERGRRAAALLGASLTPESFVVRGDQGRDTVLVHRVGTRPARGDREWLA